jgi:hypothetical protein
MRFPPLPCELRGPLAHDRHGLEPRASSRAVCGRSDGSLARHANTIPSSSLGIGNSVRADGGSGIACACWVRSCIGVSPVKTS